MESTQKSNALPLVHIGNEEIISPAAVFHAECGRNVFMLFKLSDQLTPDSDEEFMHSILHVLNNALIEHVAHGECSLAHSALPTPQEHISSHTEMLEQLSAFLYRAIFDDDKRHIVIELRCFIQHVVLPHLKM
jgi:hemerythrin